MIRRVPGEDARAAASGLAAPIAHRRPAARLALALAVALPAGSAGAQDAAVFTPTYAASPGSPYSDVYARTFGTTGRPDAAAGQAEPPPLETAAPPASALEAAPAFVPTGVPAGVPAVVYVIEGSRLLTYRASDYAGGGAAVDQAPLPPAETAYIGGAPEVRVPTIADRLYSRSAPAGPAVETGDPIPLLPPAD
ncbi:hypothetical protein [Pelagibius sp. 7325]|uniref:hypothetical protein n=1 Tax=Pelagibius sp. 7325 TaxID=3131994 RepID=UPI0030EC4783